MIKKLLQFGILLLIVVMALVVRKKNYAEIPVPGQSTDEYSYSWVGMSLLQTGMPIGISGFEGYKHAYSKYINVDRFYQVTGGNPLTINYPWMDHPPLLGLITGGYAHLAGARVFEEASTYLIRRPIIIIGALSTLLVIIFCYLNFGFVTALFAGSIYATVPLGGPQQPDDSGGKCDHPVLTAVSHFYQSLFQNKARPMVTGDQFGERSGDFI